MLPRLASTRVQMTASQLLREHVSLGRAPWPSLQALSLLLAALTGGRASLTQPPPRRCPAATAALAQPLRVQMTVSLGLLQPWPLPQTLSLSLATSIQRSGTPHA
jgi:hypothetical protein